MSDFDPSFDESPLEEKSCSGCGKISWDSHVGMYKETHTNTANQIVKCDMSGDHWIDGVRQ